MSACLHCSTPLKQGEEKFCCRGCESVFQIIHDSGHEMFYDLKADTPLTPLRERPFQERDWQWLTDRTQEESNGEIILGLSGLTCVACVWLVESVAKKQAGVMAANISITRGSVEFIYKHGLVDFSELANQLFHLGYELTAKVNTTRASSSLGIQLGICGGLAMNTMAFTLPSYTGMQSSDELHQIFTIVVIASSTLTFFIGGSYFFKRAWSALKMGSIHMDLPISIGLILAYLGSFLGWIFSEEDLLYFDFVAIFTFLMLLGKQVQDTSLSRANAKFNSENTIPESYQNTENEAIETSEIVSDQRLIIPAGTVIPTASRLVSEAAECSLAWITGEPATILYQKTAPLPAGAVNQSQDSIIVETSEDINDEHRSLTTPQQSQNLSPALGKFIRIYLLSVLVVGVVAASIWYGTTADWVKSLQVMISVYVVSCPCGIGLALPLLDTRFNKLANHIGVFPLTSTCWSGFHKLSRIVFDKTGTLTLDRPALDNSEDLEKLSSHDQEILFLLTKKSLHPLSRSLFSALIHHGITQIRHQVEVTDKPGQGVFAELEQDQFSLVRPNKENRSKKLSCVFQKNGETIAHFTFRESPREGTQNVMLTLKKELPEGTVILSGDVEESVSKLAKELNIDHYNAGLTPEQKLAHIKKLEQQGGIFYIGDGINDIPAMRAARLSAAPFANLNLVTKEVDLLFTDETLTFLPSLLRLAKVRKTLSNQLLVYTIAYNLIVVALAALGYMSPLIAAIIMPLSSLLSLFIVTRRDNWRDRR